MNSKLLFLFAVLLTTTTMAIPAQDDGGDFDPKDPFAYKKEVDDLPKIGESCEWGGRCSNINRNLYSMCVDGKSKNYRCNDNWFCNYYRGGTICVANDPRGF